MPMNPEAFPPAFDPAVYRSLHSDLWYLPDDDLRAHYARTGRAEGRRSHVLPERSDLVGIVEGAPAILEIGPGPKPLLIGANVTYFDVVDRGAQLRSRGNLDDPGAAAPEIHHVSPTGDLSIVTGPFDVVISSHAIEHQPDLAGHLATVEELLAPGGFYVVLAPDKRYCFDHFIPESSVGDVMEAAMDHRRQHSLRSLVNQSALTTHNEPVRHWAGDHGEPACQQGYDIEATLELYLHSVRSGAYVDRHAWQFTDASFAAIVQFLNDQRIVSLPAHRVYPTMAGRHEFWAVLGPKPAAAG